MNSRDSLAGKISSGASDSVSQSSTSVGGSSESRKSTTGTTINNKSTINVNAKKTPFPATKTNVLSKKPNSNSANNNKQGQSILRGQIVTRPQSALTHNPQSAIQSKIDKLAQDFVANQYTHPFFQLPEQV